MIFLAAQRENKRLEQTTPTAKEVVYFLDFMSYSIPEIRDIGYYSNALFFWNKWVIFLLKEHREFYKKEIPLMKNSEDKITIPSGIVDINNYKIRVGNKQIASHINNFLSNQNHYSLSEFDDINSNISSLQKFLKEIEGLSKISDNNILSLDEIINTLSNENKSIGIIESFLFGWILYIIGNIYYNKHQHEAAFKYFSYAHIEKKKLNSVIKDIPLLKLNTLSAELKMLAAESISVNSDIYNIQKEFKRINSELEKESSNFLKLNKKWLYGIKSFVCYQIAKCYIYQNVSQSNIELYLTESIDFAKLSDNKDFEYRAKCFLYMYTNTSLCDFPKKSDISTKFLDKIEYSIKYEFPFESEVKTKYLTELM